MPAPFQTTRIVEFGDTDMAGIVHFANFFRYMEAAEHSLLRSLGVSVTTDVGDEKYSLPRVSASCDFLSPARFGDELTITVAVEKLGRSSITYAFGFSKGAEGIARGKVTVVYCRVTPGQPLEAASLPDGLRAKLEPFLV
jgi:YbgC/YbaW family acyl-CoA thioester hydrolase